MAPKSKVAENQDILRVLRNSPSAIRTALLKSATRDIVCALCEICDNLLSGNIPLTPAQKKKVAKYKDIVRYLAKRNEGWQKKKKVLAQKGKGVFIPILLSAVASALGAKLGSKL